jgi:hypothetical protein
VQATPSSAYSMAKAGLHALTQHLALELASAGIRVNAVSPALVDTPIFEGFLPKEQIPSVLQSFNGFHRSVALAGPKRWPKSLRPCCPASPPGSPAPFGMSMEVLWRGGINTSREPLTRTDGAKFHGARRIKQFDSTCEQDCKVARGSTYDPGIHRHSDEAIGNAWKLPAWP